MFLCFEKDNPSQVRNVEDWLTEVEDRMRTCLRELIVDAANAYSRETRTKWIFDWPAQVVLTMDQVQWTHDVENQGFKQHDMVNLLKQEEEKLQDLVECVKIPRTDKIQP